MARIICSLHRVTCTHSIFFTNNFHMHICFISESKPVPIINNIASVLTYDIALLFSGLLSALISIIYCDWIVYVNISFLDFLKLVMYPGYSWLSGLATHTKMSMDCWISEQFENPNEFVEQSPTYLYNKLISYLPTYNKYTSVICTKLQV